MFLCVLLENSLTVASEVKIEQSVAHVKLYDRFQFERLGFFTVDKDTEPGKVAHLQLASSSTSTPVQAH